MNTNETEGVSQTDPDDEERNAERIRQEYETLLHVAPARVVIKLREGIDLSGEYADRLEDRLPDDVRQAWYNLMETGEIPLPQEATIGRLFSDLEGTGEDVLPELLTYYEVLLPLDREQALAVGGLIVEQLVGFEDVFEYVYVESPPAPQPQIPVCLGVPRLYLGPPTDGMNVEAFLPAAGAAWPALVDLERAWDGVHPDVSHIPKAIGLAGPNAGDALAPGLTFAAANYHATAVLGILGATAGPGGINCPGMVPAGAPLRWASCMTRVDGVWQDNIAARILSAARPGRMARGDILLLELQVWGWLAGTCPSPPPIVPDLNATVFCPVEIEPHIRSAIRQAVLMWGIIVIEPTGNGAMSGGQNLSTLRSYNLCTSMIGNSGAILVSACGAADATRHRPWLRANFGIGVDCYAYGESVPTLDVNTPAGPPANFGDTSAAAALVAGVAAMIQNAALRDHGQPLTVNGMRAALTAASLHPFAIAQQIGVMPDLAAVAGGLGVFVTIL